MKIYGYTRVCSNGGYGRESSTELYFSDAVRDFCMYKDYSETFDNLAVDEDFEKDGKKFIDTNGNPKQTEAEFKKELEDSEDVNKESFGLIQCSDFHVVYEPFCKEVGQPE